MKFNFKKIGSVIASAAMIGATAGFAAAANYPAPFDAGDYSIVIGSDLDMSAATTIGSNLMGDSTGDITIGTGDSYKLERGSTFFVLGKGILDVVPQTITEDKLGTILADGTYLDDDNNRKDYTQKITLSNLTLDLFDDSDYKQDTPTLGLTASSGDNVLNYTLDFSSSPDWDDMGNTEIEIMGKQYFISSVTENTTIELLDAANLAIVGEGETVPVTVAGETYEVTLDPSYLSGSASSPQVKLAVSGELTNSMSEGQTYKLDSGEYVGIKDISMRDVSGTTASVEFSIGTGKIELRNELPVKMNEVTVNDLTANFTSSSGNLDEITIRWETDDDLFATEDSTMVFPGLENLAISFTGMNYPAEEEIVVEKGSNTYIRLANFPLEDGNADIDLLYGNETNWLGVGKEAGKGLATMQGTSAELNWSSDLYQYFVATYDDGTNTESYLLRATSFSVKSDGVTNTTAIQYWNNGAFVDKKADAANGDSVDLGSVSLTLGQIHRTGKNVSINAGSNVYFDRLFSAEGLKVYLPIANGTAEADADAPWPVINVNASSPNVSSSYKLGFLEEQKTGATTGGNPFNVTLSFTSDKVTVSDVVGESPDGGYEIGDTDVMRSFIDGDLATEILHDTGGDQDWVKIIYHGDESYGDAYISELGAVSGSSDSNVVVLMDDEITTAQKEANLIVVGGSCVNAIAAELLGGAYCAADFTSETTVGEGAYLVKTYANPYASGKVATLVAGYEQADTVNAANALLGGLSTTVDAQTIGPQ